MDAPALVSSPTLYVTAHGEILDPPRVDDAPKFHGGLHNLKAERAERIEDISGRPSIARRMVRACTRFLLAVLIGVCGTLGWQRYGDQATELMTSQIAAHGPSLTRFVAAAKSALPRLDPTEQQTTSAVPAPEPAAAVAPALASVPVSAPAAELATNAQEAKPLDSTDTAELHQQLESITTDLAATRKTIEQLSASQDQLARTQQQMAQNIAKLQTFEQSLSQPPSPFAGAVRLPAPKPVQSHTSRSAHAAPKPPASIPSQQDRLR